MDDVGWPHKTPPAAASSLVARVVLALGRVEDVAYQVCAGARSKGEMPWLASARSHSVSVLGVVLVTALVIGPPIIVMRES